LSLKIAQGFRSTEIAKTTKEYGTLYFKFSTECQSSCTLFLVSQVILKLKIIFDKNFILLGYI